MTKAARNAVFRMAFRLLRFRGHMGCAVIPQGAGIPLENTSGKTDQAEPPAGTAALKRISLPPLPISGQSSDLAFSLALWYSKDI